MSPFGRTETVGASGVDTVRASLPPRVTNGNTIVPFRSNSSWLRWPELVTIVNLLRVRKSGILSRHRHAGPVHATVLKGRWHYLEHPWWAEEGGYAYEPPGDIHTLEVPADVKEMITLFHVTGAYIYVDVDGNTVGVEDVFSKLEKAREHYKAVGLGEEFVDQFIR